MSGQNPEFAEVSLKLSELKDLNYFRYRKVGIGKLLDYIRAIVPDGRTVFFYDTTSKNQLVSRLGLRISELRRIDAYHERNRILAEAVSASTTTAILKMTKGSVGWNVYAVVSNLFVNVYHAEIFKFVEKELSSLGLGVKEMTEFRTSQRLWRRFIFEMNAVSKIGEVIEAGIMVCNSLKGTSSIQVRSYWKRLSCENGMTSSKYYSASRVIHRGDRLKIMESVRQNIKSAVDEAYNVSVLVDKSRRVSVSHSEMSLIIRLISSKRGFAEYVQRSMLSRVMQEEANLWGLSNILTYVGSHEDVPFQSKLAIEQSAHSLLAGGEPMVRELLSPKPLVPAQPAIHAVCRECKEKPVAEVGDTCLECEVELKRVALEDDAFDHRMGLDDEEVE